MSFLPPAAKTQYFALISKIESGDNPNAKNPLSTASGRFQFIKSTWEGLGFDWSNRFNDVQQYQAIEKFTAQNAAALKAAGCAINFSTLYGSHFLGVTGFLRVMRGGAGDPIATVTTPAQRKANPTILKGSIIDFCNWLEKKTGQSVYKRYLDGDEYPTTVKPPVIAEPVAKPNNQWLVGAGLIALIAGFAGGKFLGVF